VIEERDRRWCGCRRGQSRCDGVVGRIWRRKDGIESVSMLSVIDMSEKGEGN
jgi:hypothetical protein